MANPRYQRRKSDRFELDTEILKIARICLSVFLVFLVFGFFSPTRELGLEDPPLLRIFHSLLISSAFLATYFSQKIRENIQPLLFFFFISVSLHSLLLLYWNSLYIGYLVGMILVITCISANFFEKKWMVSYLVSISITGILVGFFTKNPSIDINLYIASLLTPAIVSFLTLNIRLSSIEKLKVSESRLKAFHDRINTDLLVAQEIQKGLISENWTESQDCEIQTFFKSYEKVGGDVIRIIPLPQKRIAILFADVSGHGIGSALVSAMAVLAFKIHANEQNSPAVCLRKIHEDLQPLVTSNHISAVVAYYDPESRLFSYSYAGHPKIIHWNQKGKFEFLEGKGTLILSFLKPNLMDFSVTLNPGDSVLFYSDGLYELFDYKGEMYGEERFLESIKSNSQKPPQVFFQSIQNDCLIFSDGEVSDDMSMLLLRLPST